MSDPDYSQRYSAFGDPMINPLQRPPEAVIGEPTATRRRQRQDSVVSMGGSSNWEDEPSDFPTESMAQPQRRSASHFHTIDPEGKGGQSSAGPQSRSRGRKHRRLNSMAALAEDLPASAGSWSQTPERALNRKASMRLARRKSVNRMSGPFRSGLKRQGSLGRRPASQYVKGSKSKAEQAQWKLKRALSDINTNFELSDVQKAKLEEQKNENERRWSELETQQAELIEKMSALKRNALTTDSTDGGFLAIHSEAMKLLDSLTANVKDLFVRFEEASDLGARATFMEEHHVEAANKLREASSKVIDDVFKQQNQGNEWEDEAIGDGALVKSSDEEEDDDDDDDDEQEGNLKQTGDQDGEDKDEGSNEESDSKDVAFQNRFETSLSMKIRSQLSQTMPPANAELQAKSPNVEAFQKSGECSAGPSSAQNTQEPSRFLFGGRDPGDRRPRFRRRRTTKTNSSVGRSDGPLRKKKTPSGSGQEAEHGSAEKEGPSPRDWSLQSAESSAGGPKSTQNDAGVSGLLESNAGNIQWADREGASEALQANGEADEDEAASKDGAVSSPPLPQSGQSSASAWQSVLSSSSNSHLAEKQERQKGKGKPRGVEREASKRGRLQEAIAFDKWLNDTVEYDFKDDSPIGGMAGEDSAGIRMEFGLAEEDSLDRFGVPRPASLHWSAPPSAGYSQGSPSYLSLRSTGENQTRPGTARSPGSAAAEQTVPRPTSSSEIVDPPPEASHERDVAIQEEAPQEPGAPRVIPLPVSLESEQEPQEGEPPRSATPRAVPLPASVVSESEAEEDVPRETTVPIVDRAPASVAQLEATIQDGTARESSITTPSPLLTSVAVPESEVQGDAPLKPIIPPVNDEGSWEELSIMSLIKSQVRPWWDLLHCLWILIVVNPFCANAAIALELRAYLRWHLLGRESHWMPPVPSQPRLTPRSTLVILKHCFVALVIQVWIATTRERQIWLDANNMTRDYLVSRVYDDPSISVLPGVDLNLMAGGRAVAAVLMGGMHLLDELILPKLGEFQVDLLTSVVPIFFFV